MSPSMGFRKSFEFMRQHFHVTILAVLLSATLFFSGSGCVYLAIGAAGVVGGYIVSPDTVEGTTSHSLEEAWDASKEIVGIMGQIAQENQSGNVIHANVGGASVLVTLSAVNISTTKISVKARKSFMPKIDLAQEVYMKITNSLEQ